MRAGFGQFRTATPEYLEFAAQFGVKDILLNEALLPGDNGRWELRDLVKLRLSIEQWGMNLSAGTWRHRPEELRRGSCSVCQQFAES